MADQCRHSQDEHRRVKVFSWRLARDSLFHRKSLRRCCVLQSHTANVFKGEVA